MSSFSYDQFVTVVRSAMHYLYDPDHLRRSPLAGLLGVANRPDTPSAMQRILVEFIESLEPGPKEPPESRRWRIHDALFYLYVRRLDRNLVAEQLGVSERQLRREQRAALEVLAELLWKKYVREDPGSAPTPQSESGLAAEPGAQKFTDLEWLKNTPPEQPTDIKQQLAVVLELTSGLAQQHGVTISSDIPDHLPEASINPVAFRETLINLVCAAILRLPGGAISIEAYFQNGQVVVALHAVKPNKRTGLTAENGDHNLDMARELAQYCGGTLTVTANQENFQAAFSLPAQGHVPVLVIDDNADSHQLFQRYASGSRYRVTGVSNPLVAERKIKELSPQVVILDVLMPEADGWDLLARFRQDPATNQIPIVMCSILPQEALVRSLGANAFLRKPVSRLDFLNTLDRLTQIDKIS